jgi:uncharacterized protein YrrD
MDPNNEPMDRAAGFTVAIGDEVRGRDGKLGEVERVIVDADSDRIFELVVRHGFLWGNERLVPLSCISHGDGSVLYADIDQEQFKEFDGFDPARYREPDPDYTGPPGFDIDSGHNFPLEQAVARGPLLFFATGKPLGYPGGERVPPASEGQNLATTRPSIEAGDDILDRNFEKVGEVAEFAADERGVPVRLVGRKGFLFHKEAEIPADWISDLTDKGVVLAVDKADVERRIGFD